VLSLTILGGGRAIPFSQVYDCEQALKIGKLVKVGKVSRFRGFYELFGPFGCSLIVGILLTN
jgi:hypothetical protein